ncbi:DedA family protein [Millisia brevis]|uniref:DedA family protein n=1 Tax=Millisia brevis TaxID=264148 RepID=UPI000830FEAC|nr:VTT domain-containing protein [Millisia brevis]
MYTALALTAASANPLDPTALLHSFGSWALAGIAVVVFIESGVLFPFLPGDSLLVTAAILAPALGLSSPTIAIVATLAAIAGDQVGYTLGRRFGRRLFTPDARVLKTSRLEEAERFFERYGPAALVLGRFVPVVRTYVPLAAGTAGLHYPRFLMWNALGGSLWACGMVAAGVFLGGIPLVANHIDVLMIVIVAVSVLPIVINILLRRRRGHTTVASDLSR